MKALLLLFIMQSGEISFIYQQTDTCEIPPDIIPLIQTIKYIECIDENNETIYGF